MVTKRFMHWLGEWLQGRNSKPVRAAGSRVIIPAKRLSEFILTAFLYDCRP